MYACLGEEAVFTIVGRGGDLFVCQKDISNSFQKHSSYRTSALGRITQGNHITYYSLTFFIAYTFKGHMHVFAGRVKILSHSSCRTSAVLQYCHLYRSYTYNLQNFTIIQI